MDRSPFPTPLPRVALAFLAASLVALGSATLFAQDAEAPELSGAIRLVGMWRPTGTPEFDESDVLRAIFLQVDVVPAVESGAEEVP